MATRLSCARSGWLPCSSVREPVVSPSPDFVSTLWHRANSAPNTYRGSALLVGQKGAGRKRSRLRPRNTFVPSCRPTRERGAGWRAAELAARSYRARGRGRDPEEPTWALADESERERASNQAQLAARCSCPRRHPRLHRACGETDLATAFRHLVRAPPCMARVRRRAHPLSSV
jgi:hypothetical protein